MAVVETKSLRKEFGHTIAVDGIDLETAEGEYLVLLGPSGCGKTTLLRLIAGLEHPSHGDILIGGQVVTHLPPRARQIAMVFQSYALYPHKTVFANIAFPLAAAGMPREQRPERVHWAASRLGIDGLLDRRPRHCPAGCKTIPSGRSPRTSSRCWPPPSNGPRTSGTRARPTRRREKSSPPTSSRP